MAIECFAIFPNGERNKKFHNNPVKILTRVEAGRLNTYHCTQDALGAVVLAGCFDMDNGGVVYVTNEEKLAEAVSENGSYSAEKLESQFSETMPPGGLLALPIVRNSSVEYTLLFMHQSPN